jgi:chromosome segregation ATPase
VSQIRAASDRAAEAERLRKGALQEAAFYRAKVATLESNSPLDLARIEKERISELERQLASLHQNHTMAQKELEKLSGQNSGSRDLHTDSVQRENETLKRAEDAEDAHRLAIEEMEELQQRVKLAENSLREHGERLISTQSLAQQREAENDRLRSQLEEAITTRDDHLSVIDQVQKAVLAAGVRSTEIEDMYNRSQQKILELEEELTENRAELEARGRESEVIQTRMRDVENAYAKSREEADSLRNVTTSRLGELLASHRSIKEDESRLTRGHGDQVRALEEESNSLRKMLKEAGQRLDAAESGFMGHRAKTRDLELSHHGLKAEMRGIRGKLTSAQQELSKWKQLYESKDDELREREAALTEIETRCSTLRNLRELIEMRFYISQADR